LIEIVPATEATDEVRELIGELDQVLSAEYPPEQRHGLALDAIFQPHIRFFIARMNGEPAACGGVALFSDFAEVKRMYVRQRARGRGLAKALLRRIEREALAAGVTRLCLETGDRQQAAMRLYEGAGFLRCGPFGPYAAMPSQAIATSVFYDKPLVEGGVMR
jgi:putative acetyltransferase